MSRFVILHHEVPGNAGNQVSVEADLINRGNHWDLMVEDGAALKTWALPFLPAPGMEGHAVQLPDHRLKYLDYEGEVSNGRGSVKRVNAGSVSWLLKEADALIFVLDGELNCQVTCQRNGETWRVRFEPE